MKITRVTRRMRSKAQNIKFRSYVSVFTTLSHRTNNARVFTSCASGEKLLPFGREGILGFPIAVTGAYFFFESMRDRGMAHGVPECVLLS